MATLLEIGLLKYFGIIFPLLLVWAVTFGILEKSELFGKDKHGLNSIIAMLMAFLTILWAPAVDVINLMAPWVVLLGVLFFSIIAIFKMFGVSDKAITAEVATPTVAYWIIILILIVFLASLAKVVKPETFVTGGSTIVNVTTNQSAVGTGGEEAFWATFFHPKVLGMLMIILVATLTIKMLTTEG